MSQEKINSVMRAESVGVRCMFFAKELGPFFDKYDVSEEDCKAFASGLYAFGEACRKDGVLDGMLDALPVIKQAYEVSAKQMPKALADLMEGEGL